MRLIESGDYEFDKVDYLMIMNGLRDGNVDEQIDWLNNIKQILEYCSDDKYYWNEFIRGMKSNMVVWVMEEIYGDADNHVFNLIQDILNMIQSANEHSY